MLYVNLNAIVIPLLSSGLEKKKQYGLSQFLFAALSFIPIRIHKNIFTHCVTLNEQGVRLFVCVCMPECAIKSTLFYCLSLSSPLFQLFS